MHNKQNMLKNYDYFFKYDYLYKYNLNELSQLPHIQDITLTVPLTTLVRASSLFGLKNSVSFKMRLFMLLYLLTALTPYIGIQPFKLIKNQEKLDNEFRYLLKVTFSNKTSIINFLLNLFLENQNGLKKNMNFTTHLESLLLLKKFSTKLSVPNSSIIYTFPVTVEYFSDLYYFFNKLLFGLTHKDLIFFIKFKIYKPQAVINSVTFIKNLPFFWAFK